MRRRPDSAEIMVKLPQKGFCALLGAALALAGGFPAWAEELTTRLPPYRPKIGEERLYRVEIETSANSHGLTKVGEKDLRGEFSNSLTVLESTPTGFKMRWRLSPKEPPQGQSGLTEIFRDRIQAFGTDTIEVETDRRGAATKIDNLDALRQAVEKRIADLKTDDPAKGRLQALLPRLQPGSLFPMDVIAPAARLFAEAQASEEREADLGMPRTANAEGRSNGASSCPSNSPPVSTRTKPAASSPSPRPKSSIPTR